MTTEYITREDAAMKQQFDAMCQTICTHGYDTHPLTSPFRKACIGGIVLAVIISTVAMTSFLFMYERPAQNSYTAASVVFLCIGILLLSVWHEMLHVTGWALCAKNHWDAIGFGFIWDELRTFSTCAEPLPLCGYLTGLLFPFLGLSVLPITVAMLTGNALCLIFGMLSTLATGEDLYIFINILRHPEYRHGLFLHHPVKTGVVCFTERKEQQNV